MTYQFYLNKLLYERAFGFLFWFLSSVILLIAFYNPFEQPIFFDRAYLVYVSQVIYRGDPVYSSTTFGYTPFSTILVGIFMKVGSLFSLNTIQSARILGIAIYGSMSGCFFLLSKELWTDKKGILLSCLLFTGMGYITILSGINAEPKIWVLLFSILGILYFNRSNWFMCGFLFSLAAMSWHVAVVSLIACFIMLPFRTRSLYPSAGRLFAGVLIGTLPIILYLLFTHQVVDFWQQAVIRKISMEGKEVGESPLYWLRMSIYPSFTTEIFHFILALIGFVMISLVLVQRKTVTASKFKSFTTLTFLWVYTVLWAVFNSLEFQSNVDMFPLIPIVVIFSAYTLLDLSNRIPTKLLTIGFFILIFVYCYLDAFFYKIPYSYSEQQHKFRQLDTQYGDALAIQLPEYYVVMEKAGPTKYINFAPYEENYLKISCDQVVEQLAKKEITYIIELDRSKRTKSKWSEKFMNTFGVHNQMSLERTECAKILLSPFHASPKVDHFFFDHQSITWSDKFFTREEYIVYKIKPDSFK